MRLPIRSVLLSVGCVAFAVGCGGATSNPVSVADDPMIQSAGSISISLTDGPWEDAQALVLHITGIDLGHTNGEVVALEMPGGPMSIDMMQLQNGISQALVSEMTVPAGQYEWMRLVIDLQQSHLDVETGARHNMQMGPESSNGLEVQHFYEITESVHAEFMLDFDLRQGVQRHDMGMMGDQYELHSAMRLVNMQDSGGMTGLVEEAMIDVNHPDCDDALGGNWVYLYHGGATDPDDISEQDSDGRPGPMATDRVEMDPGTGEFSYHFGYLPAGSYRVAFTCSGEWDEDGDDDYPSDPDGRFDFQMFSGPLEVVHGQLHRFDLSDQ